MPSKAIVALLILILLGSSITAMFILFPNTFNNQSNTLLSVSQIYVDPQGAYEQFGEFRGAFWDITAVVNQIDQFAGVKVLLENGQKTTVNWNNVQTSLKSGAKIEIKIEPQPAYLIRTLREKVVTVTPETGRTYSGILLTGIGEALNEQKANTLTVFYYDWDEPTFRIYCPFKVSFYKDGSLVGERTFNTEGAANVQTIPTSEGTIRLENLGILQGQYLSPNVPAQICLLKGYPCLYDWTQVQSLIPYDAGAIYINTPFQNTVGIRTGTSTAYSTYWFGTNRWSDNKHPNAVLSPPTLLNAANYGGWVNTDVIFRYQRDAVKPVVYPTEKTSLPESKRNFKSLTEYIEQTKGVQNLANTIFNNYQSPEIIWEGFAGTAKPALKLHIPWNGYATYGSPLVHIRVPSELADTFVDRPPVSNVKVSLKWEDTGTTTTDISGTKRLIATLTQQSSVSSTTEVSIECGNNRVGLYPLSTRVSLAPNEVKNIFFDVTNLGKEERQDGVPITVICKDTYTGSETSRATAYANLLATLTPGKSILKLKFVEKTSQLPIIGLQFQVRYATETISSCFSGDYGRWESELALPSGGAWVGDVLVTSAATEKYQSTSNTIHVDVGITEKVIEVLLLNEEPPFVFPEWVWWLVGSIVAVVAVAAGAQAVAKKRRRRY